MSFKNIKANQGFTIVELLIVVVVIAILAAITIVSYNGITQQANASAAKSTAASLQKKIELYYAKESTYPTSFATLTGAASSDPYYVPTGSISVGTPTSGTGKTTVRVVNCSTTGVQIEHFDYEAGSGFKAIKIGTGTCPTTGYWT